jgi:hypothetical protein
VRGAADQELDEKAKQANPGDSSMQPDEVAAPRVGKPKPDDLLGQSLVLRQTLK